MRAAAVRARPAATYRSEVGEPRGGCAVNAVTWKDIGPEAPYASARVRIILKPGQIMQIDGAQPHAMGLLCGADASNLAAIAPAELIVAGGVEKD